MASYRRSIAYLVLALFSLTGGAWAQQTKIPADKLDLSGLQGQVNQLLATKQNLSDSSLYVRKLLNYRLMSPSEIAKLANLPLSAVDNTTYSADKSVQGARDANQDTLINKKPTIVADITALAGFVRGNVTSVLVQNLPQAAIFVWKASGYTPNGGTVYNAVGGGYWVLATSLPTSNPKWWAAKGDSLSNDTAPIQAALNGPGRSVLLENGVFLVDELTVPAGKQLIIDRTASLLNRSVSNTTDRAMLHLLTNSSVTGGGILNGNGPALAASRTNIYANNFVISVDGDSVKIDGITIKNALSASISAIGRKNLVLSNITDIGAGRGPFIVRCEDVRASNIVIRETNMVYPGIYQHCIDFIFCRGVKLDGLKILNVNSSSAAPSITISGLTLLGNADSQFQNLTFDGFLSTVNDGLCIADDGSYNSSISNVLVTGWKYGVGLEIQGSRSSKYSNILIDGSNLSNTASGSVGMHVLDTAIEGGLLASNMQDWQSRDRAVASNNTFTNIQVVGGYAGFRVAGSGNTFVNCTATGQYYGWRIQQMQGGTITGYWRSSIQQNVEDNVLTDCSASLCQFGFAIWGGKGNRLVNPKATNCVFGISNQTWLQSNVASATTTTATLSTSATANTYKNYQLYITNGTGMGQIRTISSHTTTVYSLSTAWTVTPDSTSEAVVVDNPQGTVYITNPTIKDNQSFTLVGAVSFPGSITSPAQLTAITITTGGERISYNQKIKLKNVITGASSPDLIVQVTALDKTTSDRFYITPVSLGNGSVVTGTLAPTLVSGTGTVASSNFTVLNGAAQLGKLIGSSTNFPGEIDAHYWVLVNSEWKQVLKGVSDTEYWLTTPISTSASGLSFQILKADLEGIPVMTNAISFNRYYGDVVIRGNVDLSGSSSSNLNSFRSRSANSIELTPNSTTPSVALGNLYRTNNSSATLLTNFTNGYEGQVITVEVADANTTLLFPSGSLKGYNANYAASIGDVITATYNGTYWLCSVMQVGGRWKYWEFGDPNSTNAVLKLYGSNTGADQLIFNRSVGTTNSFGIGISGGFLGFRDITNSNVYVLGLQNSGSLRRAIIGQDKGSAAVNGEIGAESVTGTLTDSPGGNLVVSAGRGTGAATVATIDLYTADAGSSGTTEQARSLKAQITALGLLLKVIPTYADNTAAVAGGLQIGQLYKTSTGQLMIRY